MIKNIRNKLGNRYQIFKKLHDLILFSSEGVEFRIFPIYIAYFFKDKNVALIYYAGKLVRDGELDLGLNLKENPTDKRFIKADYMHYPGITHSIKIRRLKDIDLTLAKIIKFACKLER